MELTLTAHLVLTIVGIATAIASSYIIGTRFVAPYVIKLIELRYNNDEWLQNTMARSYKLMAKEMRKSMIGTTLADIKTLHGAEADVDDGMLNVAGDLPINADSIKFFQTMAKSPARANKLREYLELYAEYAPMLNMIQQQGGNGQLVQVANQPPSPLSAQAHTREFHGSAW